MPDRADQLNGDGAALHLARDGYHGYHARGHRHSDSGRAGRELAGDHLLQHVSADLAW